MYVILVICIYVYMYIHRRACSSDLLSTFLIFPGPHVSHMFPSGSPGCSHLSPGTPQKTPVKFPSQCTHVFSLLSARVVQLMKATDIFLPEEGGKMYWLPWTGPLQVLLTWCFQLFNMQLKCHKPCILKNLQPPFYFHVPTCTLGASSCQESVSRSKWETYSARAIKNKSF